MKKGKLSNGFEYEIDENLIEDMEFLEDFSNEEEPFSFFRAIRRMFPGDKKKELYDFCRDPERKIVPSEKVGEVVGMIIEDAREDGKNS